MQNINKHTMQVATSQTQFYQIRNCISNVDKYKQYNIKQEFKNTLNTSQPLKTNKSYIHEPSSYS